MYYFLVYFYCYPATEKITLPQPKISMPSTLSGVTLFPAALPIKNLAGYLLQLPVRKKRSRLLTWVWLCFILLNMMRQKKFLQRSLMKSPLVQWPIGE